MSEELARLVAAEAALPFDISQPPLLRATLFPGEDKLHLLVLVLHHLISDRTSLRILHDEIAELYQQRATHGRYDGRLPPPPRYTDFAERQWATFSSETPSPALRYWKDQYLRYGSAHLSATTLSIAKSTAGPASTGTASECVLLGEDETRDVLLGARRAGVTLHMFALAACGVLLQPHARRNTLALWGYASNRTTVEAQRMIGWLANNTLLAVDVDSTDTASQLLAQVRRTVCSAARYQDVPVFAVWLHMALESSTPSVQWPHDDLVSFDTYPLAESRAPRALAGGVTLGDAPQHVASPLQHAIRQPALTLQVAHGNNRLGLICGYRAARFDPADVRGMVEHFARIVRRMSRRDATVGELLAC
jgi:hypothetical protein